ncbi:hypothetical protein BDW02DRAFT_136258 [Decorospora gaudefroyi]|uniref:RING-type domain-containing protein n=1 Tax=Decorospora gaudefroyi TaxID=184978 RepID=A0A6A5K0Y1_9PLEO|nr:hypothetical protein BDW02DRAFT_136258 [Decorospora gaudefroyi]
MRRLLAAFWRSRGLHQYGLLSYWKYGMMVPETVLNVGRVHQEFPSLRPTMLDAVMRLTPEEVGIFISTLRRCAELLGVFFLQDPPQAFLTVYCEDLSQFVVECCPGITIDCLEISELATLVKGCMDRRFAMNPQEEARIHTLLPLIDDGAILRAARFNWTMMLEICTVLLKSCMPMFRDQMNFRRFFSISRAFADEERSLDHPPPWRGLEDFPTITDNTMDDLRPTGERVPLEAFCVVVGKVPDDITCPVCMSDVQEDGKDEEEPVVTKCGHFFHRACLDGWVNESAMNASNTCPSCRAEMCEHRQRMHVSQSADEIETADEDAGTD